MSIERKYCCYCGRWIAWPLNPTKEHVIPKSKGGNSRPYNKLDCCHMCNTWRGDRSLQDFKHAVLNYINHKNIRNGYHKQDLEAMVENIEHVMEYVRVRGALLYREPKQTLSGTGHNTSAG